MIKFRRLVFSFLAGTGLAALLLFGASWQADAMMLALTSGSILYVAPGGNCGSASPCYATVQAAVDQAVAGDEIRIAVGNFSGVSTVGNMTQVVYIAKNLILRGGYNSNFSTWDPQLYPTILDAQSQGRVISIIGPANVSIAGLRVTNGNSSNVGGLYSGQYSCNTLNSSGAGGGLCIQNANVTLSDIAVLTNTATTKGGRGGGLMVTGSVLTMTNSTVQGNRAGTGYNKSYGGGIFLNGGQAIIENNLIVNNDANPNYDGDGGGVYVNGTQTVLHGNNFFGNSVRGSVSSTSRLGGGGVAVASGNVTLTSNRFETNSATGYTGGGVAWAAGQITMTRNLVVNNTASWGGGVWAGNAPATLDNNLLADNIASGHGSGLYVNTYIPNTPLLRHNTIARNSGGDDTAIYVADHGRVDFLNTIISENIIGVGMGWSTSISFNRTLWDGNITDTLGAISDVGHLAGAAAFAVDGYHLSEASAAIDAGIDAGLSDDIDGEARPHGSAPDIGADESPFGQSVGGENVRVDKLALAPRLMLSTYSAGGVPVYLVQQEYLIQLANGLTDTALSSFAVEDRLPVELDYAGEVHYPPMDFVGNGNVLTWSSREALAADHLAWMSVVGNAEASDGGKVITNVAEVAYSLATGESFNKTVRVSSEIPNFPPFITKPENGEYCLDAEGDLEIWGLAKPGATISVSEDGVPRVEVTASISGTFYASFVPTQWSPAIPVTLSATDCTGGNCGEPSNTVRVWQSANGWCPQRSRWEGKLGENLFRWPFRDANGNMTTSNWEIPGAYGFRNTTLKLYACDVPDEGYGITGIVVEADGVFYEDADGAPDAEGAWEFGIAGAHSVNIVVSAENAIGATKTYSSHGWVLVDPDGFIFDTTQGFEVISSTVQGVPIEVANTIPGITVTCMVSMPQWGGWMPWPAQYYDQQINPQVTGEDGYFAFFTPPGHYYLQVDGSAGFQSWRSPVIEVITEIVHVNVPLTPLGQDAILERVNLTPAGPSQPVIHIPVGRSVEWLVYASGDTPLSQLARLIENPIYQLLSDLDPLNNILGWDSGRLIPGQVYRRQYTRPGTFNYTDGAGHTGQVIVREYLYLPVIGR